MKKKILYHGINFVFFLHNLKLFLFIFYIWKYIFIYLLQYFRKRMRKKIWPPPRTTEEGGSIQSVAANHKETKADDACTGSDHIGHRSEERPRGRDMAFGHVFGGVTGGKAPSKKETPHIAVTANGRNQAAPIPKEGQVDRHPSSYRDALQGAAITHGSIANPIAEVMQSTVAQKAYALVSRNQAVKMSPDEGG